MTEREIRRRNRPNLYSDELLLDAAADVFHRRGFHEASLAEVAAQAGVTRPTFYARFGTKEALYDRVMERFSDSLIDAMALAYEGFEREEDPERATARPVTAFFAWVQTHPAGFHLLFAADEGAPTGIDHRSRALARLTDLIADATAAYLRSRGMRSGRVTGLLAAFGVGVLHHGARWALENDALERMDLSTFSTTFFLRGLQGVDPDTVATLRSRRPRP